jgi:hypothetical protein
MPATARPYTDEQHTRLFELLAKTGIPLIYAPGDIPHPRRPRTIHLPELQRDDTGQEPT